MKGSKYIVIRLLFLITILLCLGLEVFTYSHPVICNIETSSEQKNEDNNIFSKIDSFENDHIIQVQTTSNVDKQLILISISKDSFLFNELSFSSWKPPKYS